MGRGTEVRKRTHQINVRLTPAEYAAVTEAAADLGISPSEYLRTAAARGAERALREVADAWRGGQWTVITPKIKAESQPQRIIGTAQAVTDWLRNRAALVAPSRVPGEET